MSNNEKALEIVGGNWMAFNKEFSAAMKMADWKDGQHAEKLRNLFGDGVEIDGSFWNIDELIEELI